MAGSVISHIAETMAEESSSTPIEAYCREKVAGLVMERGRLLAADEIEREIADDVREMAMAPDLEEIEEDGKARMSQDEYDALDDSLKLEGGLVLAGRKAVKAEVYESREAERIAKRIAEDLSSIAHSVSLCEGGFDVGSMYFDMPSCPVCCSDDVVETYSEDGVDTFACLVCGATFSVDRPFEPLVSDMGEGYSAVIYPTYVEVLYDGMLVDSFTVPAQDAYDMVTAISSKMAQVSPGAMLVSTSTGSESKVASVEGDEVTIEGGGKASRAKCARAIESFSMISDMSDVPNFEVKAGKEYDMGGERVRVDSVRGDEVYYTLVSRGRQETCYDMFCLPKTEFLRAV